MKKPLFDKVAIVGVGLIGGSLGLAIKKAGLARLVVGVARRKATIDEALSRKAVDAATLRLDAAVRGADLVILCAPVYQIVDQIKSLKPLLKKGAIVIDVGSSKSLIVSAARKHLKGHAFVGCHPMAGSEKCGIEFARQDLFVGAVCFMTSENTKVSLLWKSVGARTVRIGAKEHDAWVAKASHYPHLSAFIQFLMLERLPRAIEYSVRGRLNPSLQPAARLSKSNALLWAEILQSNGEQVQRCIDEASDLLKQFRKAVRNGNRAALRKLILRANQSSQWLQSKDPGDDR